MGLWLQAMCHDGVSLVAGTVDVGFLGWLARSCGVCNQLGEVIVGGDVVKWTWSLVASLVVVAKVVVDVFVSRVRIMRFCVVFWFVSTFYVW